MTVDAQPTEGIPERFSPEDMAGQLLEVEHIARYRELEDIITMLGTEELAPQDRLIVQRAGDLLQPSTAAAPGSAVGRADLTHLPPRWDACFGARDRRDIVGRRDVFTAFKGRPDAQSSGARKL